MTLQDFNLNKTDIIIEDEEHENFSESEFSKGSGIEGAKDRLLGVNSSSSSTESWDNEKSCRYSHYHKSDESEGSKLTGTKKRRKSEGIDNGYDVLDKLRDSMAKQAMKP